MARRGAHLDEIAHTADVELGKRADRALGLALGGAESGEIMLPEQHLRRLVHGLGIEPLRHPPDLALFQRRRRAAVEDAVEIVAAGSRKARIEAIGDYRRLQDGNARVGRLQMGIDGITDLVAGPGFGEIDMRHLGGGVHAGVGATGGT